jgi:formate C-acetyltransferase
LATEAVKASEPYWPVINPSPLLSSTFIDCVDSGADVSRGGTKYNNTGCMGGALANAADSLTAVKRLVYDENRLTIRELIQILRDDWAGNERLQAYAKNRLPKWGNNDSEVDGVAKNIVDAYTAHVNGRPNNRGGIFVASMFSLDVNIRWGKRMGALPDGRAAGRYLSKNIGAMTAMDKAGVTAHIESVTKLDFENIPNGSSLDIYLHPSAVAGEQGIDSLVGLIRTFFARGGFGIQFNVFDAKTLRDAQRNPQKYATLQVRVCGWNVYFITLGKEAQEQFINTAVHTF